MHNSILFDIIKFDKRYRESADSLVFDFSEKSESSEFYNDQFSENEHSVERIKGVDASCRTIPNDILRILDITRHYLSDESIILELGGSYLQYRSGFLNEKYKNYFPVDISGSSMTRYSQIYKKASIVSNAESIPLNDKSVDCVLSHTFLEHVTNPDQVLRESERIVKKGGLVIHSDAWHCRWWQRFGIVGIRNFSSLSLKEKIIYLGAKFTEFPLVRMPIVIAKRIFIELFSPTNHPVALRYGKLRPNYSLHLYCDEDAASSIDPLDVIRFYESRGFKFYRKLSFYQRIFFRDPFVILIKQ